MDGFVTVPEWTEVQQKSGLDPLGFQTASVRLYQELVPGISNVTLRTRYRIRDIEDEGVMLGTCQGRREANKALEKIAYVPEPPW